MAWQLTLYSLVALGAAANSMIVAAQAWQHHDERGARPFMGLMVALSGWSLAYAVQLGFTTQAGQLVWQRVGLAIGGVIPTLWFLFTLVYAGRDEWLTRSKQVALAVEPLLFALLTLTNPAHGFIWGNATLIPSIAGPLVNISLEAGYYLHIAYAYLLVAAGLGLLTLVFVRTSSIYRQQSGFLILGALPPFVANIVFTLQLSWGPLPALDLTPFAFTITGVLFALALFQFDLLERTPIARRHVLDETGDGVMVLDGKGHVVDTNSVARRALDPQPSVGQPITAISSAEVETAEAALEDLDEQTVMATVEGRKRAYDLKWSSLTDHHGEVVGHVIHLRDVTNRNEYEQRLEVAQRVLRHNLRNDMNVILGHADMLAEKSTNGKAASAQRIIDTADDLIDLSEKTQTLAGMEASKTDGRSIIDARDQLVTLVTEFQTDHPEVTIEYEMPETVEIRLPDEEFLDISVGNLLENAIEHNDAAEPWVQVRVESGGKQIRIHVEDNGPEIPPMEREVLEEGREDPLKHGSGMGLWLAHWSVKTAGGNISFDVREPRGNIVTLELPAMEQTLSYIILT